METVSCLLSGSDPAGKSDILVSTYVGVGPGTLCLDDVRGTDEASEQPLRLGVDCPATDICMTARGPFFFLLIIYLVCLVWFFYAAALIGIIWFGLAMTVCGHRS